MLYPDIKSLNLFSILRIFLQLSHIADRGCCNLFVVVDSCHQCAVTMIYADLGWIPLVIDKVSCQLSQQIQFQLNQNNFVSAQRDTILSKIHLVKGFNFSKMFLYFIGDLFITSKSSEKHI